jgi:hypothetical protein
MFIACPKCGEQLVCCEEINRYWEYMLANDGQYQWVRGEDDYGDTRVFCVNGCRDAEDLCPGSDLPDLP